MVDIGNKWWLIRVLVVSLLYVAGWLEYCYCCVSLFSCVLLQGCAAYFEYLYYRVMKLVVLLNSTLLDREN